MENPDNKSNIEFTHINTQGHAKMVDISSKSETHREAVASASVYMKKTTLEMIRDGGIKKGDVLSVAQVGGIMGAKSTPNIIPMCHPIFITGCDIIFEIDFERNKIDIIATVKNVGQTGVEMEAMTAASVAALTIYDMCKSVDREIIIADIMLIKKSGGKSGLFERK